jgi:hypothetical protein
VRPFGVVVAEIAFQFQAEVEPGLFTRGRPVAAEQVDQLTDN